VFIVKQPAYVFMSEAVYLGLAVELSLFLGLISRPPNPIRTNLINYRMFVDLLSNS
jgi:hypothetical protein